MTLGMRWPSTAETIHEGADTGYINHTQKQQALRGRILYCISVHHAVGAVFCLCFFFFFFPHWRPHGITTAAAAKLLQSCLTLCNPIDGSPPGSPVPGILQARTLEWVAISFSNAWKWKGKGKSLSLVWLFATPWTAAHQAPPSMGFSRQECWSGVPLHNY